MHYKTVLLILGIILVALSGFAYFFTVTDRESFLGGIYSETETDRPYSNLALPLFLAGILVIIVAAVLPGFSGYSKSSVEEGHQEYPQFHNQGSLSYS